jgi:hypothetical protein
MRPHSQEVAAAMGMCSCSLPVTMSGARVLISTTATQIPAMPAADHAIHDPSAVAEREVDGCSGDDVSAIAASSG